MSDGISFSRSLSVEQQRVCCQSGHADRLAREWIQVLGSIARGSRMYVQ